MLSNLVQYKCFSHRQFRVETRRGRLYMDHTRAFISDGPLALGAHFKSEDSANAFERNRSALVSDLDGSFVFATSEQIGPWPSSSGNTSQTICSHFDPRLYMPRLGSSTLGHTLLTASEIPSTQEFMRRHGIQLGDGIVMVADRQSSGKGRGGNTWTSPDGCLMFSAGQKLKVPGAQAPFINYVVSLAVVRGIHDAIRESAPNLSAPLDIRIKWPNDIYTSKGLKIGGVLIHTTWSKDRFNVVTGVGLNVSNRQPTTCIDQMFLEACGTSSSGSESAFLNDPPDVPRGIPREALLASIVTQLEACFQVFESQGFSPLEEEYLRAWLHSGQHVLAHDPVTAPESGLANSGVDSGEKDSDPLPLIILGLSEQGFLLARDESGRSYELTPDGNSLDMMKGLIRRKVN